MRVCSTTRRCIASSGLLERDDDPDMVLLKRAMEREPLQVVYFCEALRDRCWFKAGKDETYEWHRRICERMEHNEIRMSDKFDRHGLDPAVLAQMQVQLKSIPGLRRVYFAQNRMRHMPDLGGRLRSDSSRVVLRHIQPSVQFPGETMIFSVEGASARSLAGSAGWVARPSYDGVFVGLPDLGWMSCCTYAHAGKKFCRA